MSSYIVPSSALIRSSQVLVAMAMATSTCTVQCSTSIVWRSLTRPREGEEGLASSLYTVLFCCKIFAVQSDCRKADYGRNNYFRYVIVVYIRVSL